MIDKRNNIDGTSTDDFAGDRAVLWQAIVLLEKALKSSPSNFQIKLVLIRFYSLLGKSLLYSPDVHLRQNYKKDGNNT